MKILLAASLALGVLSVTAGAAETAPRAAAPEASIPFANHGGIRDWEADRDKGLWVQDIHRKWYYAKFMGPCIGIDFANSLGFDTHPMGSFDRFSEVIVPREGRCTIQSFVPSAGPQMKQKGRKPHTVTPTPADEAGATTPDKTQ